MGETTRSYPAYLALYESGELRVRATQALRLLSPCRLCPRGCRLDRLSDERGECHVGRLALVSSHGPHFGEEPVLRGRRGSGTVFFAGCNLHCVYCQNYDISQLVVGRLVSASELSRIFLEVQDAGCHNLNLVTPTHVVPQILEALVLAIGQGFSLPLVYNTSSYDSLLALRLLDGVVDIYMPDVKYADAELGFKYSTVRSYDRVVRRTVKEMHRQTGDLRIDGNGVARRGLLIRHLVLPNDLSGTRRVLEFIARELSPGSYVNLMAQYRPAYKAFQYPELSRPPSYEEFSAAARHAIKVGIHRGIPFSQ